jgi:hypothetical protein
MVQIVRPGTPIVESNARVSIAQTAAGSGGQASIGSQIMSVGQQLAHDPNPAALERTSQLIIREGERFFEESKAAHQNALYNNLMNEARLAFASGKMKREEQITDEDGNPSFMNLPRDVKSLGDAIQEEINGRVIDPEVANKFNIEWNSFVTSQQISSMKTARSQRTTYVRSSIDDGLSSILEAAQVDNLDNLPIYEGQANQLLDDFFVSGALSEEEYRELKQNYPQVLRKKMLQNEIEKDPIQINSMIIESTPEELGVTSEDKKQLEEQAKAKISSDKIEAEKAANAIEIEQKNQQALLAQEIDKRIEADAIREDEILKLEDRLDANTAAKLKRKAIQASEKRAKSRRINLEISTQLATGGDLSVYSDSQIDNHYKAAVETRELISGQPLSLSDQAEIAVTYNRPIKEFERDLESALQYGDLETAADAVGAYTYGRDRNSKAVHNVNKDHIAIATLAEQYIERSNLDPKEAVRRARETVLDKNDPVRKQRESEWKDIVKSGGAFWFTGPYGDYRPDALEETMSSNLDIESAFLRRNPAIQDDIKIAYKDMVKDAYLRTGDMRVAEDIANDQIMKTHGITEINGEREFVYNPIERDFNEAGISTETVRNDLNNSLREVFGEDTDVSRYKIYADEKTRGFTTRFVHPETGDIMSREIQSYYVTQEIESPSGVPYQVPVLDPNTGELMRYTPDLGNISDELKLQEEIRRAEAQVKAEAYDKLTPEEKIEKALTDAPFTIETGKKVFKQKSKEE